MTDDQITVIRDSYTRLLPEVDRVSQLFYRDLFQRVPRLRELFREDIGPQGMRFMSAIGFIVENLDDDDELNRQTALLADGHAQFNLRPEAYREMEEALIDTFAHALGEHFTNPVELAWRSAFRQICDEMIARTPRPA
ncbi:MAG: globin domain-containing protein [Pseudomonadota bacterium]